MSNPKRPEYIDPDTGKVKNIHVIPPVPTPREVHEFFQTEGRAVSRGDNYDEGSPNGGSIAAGARSPVALAYPGWGKQRKLDIEPGPVRIATDMELAKYNEIIKQDGEEAAREWLNVEWTSG